MAKKHPTPDTENDIVETPKHQEIKIQGFTFTVPAPYAEGHVISEAEAYALNQTYAENLRNNFAKSVKDAQEAGGEVDTATLQEQLTEYAAGYTFQMRRSRGTTIVDPVMREAEKIARQMVIEGLQKRSIKLKDLQDGVLEGFIAKLLDKNPEIKEEAQRRVSLTVEASADLFASLEESAEGVDLQEAAE
jgi:hypothetical protein